MDQIHRQFQAGCHSADRRPGTAQGEFGCSPHFGIDDSLQLSGARDREEGLRHAVGPKDQPGQQHVIANGAAGLAEDIKCCIPC